jgi:hypothetical protein
MRLVRSVILATAAATVAVLTPSAALADAVGHSDPAGDVRSIPWNDGDIDIHALSTAEPTAALGDVLRVRVSHRSSSVQVIMKFRALTRTGFVQEHTFQFLTPTRNRIVFIDAVPGNWAGKATMRTPQMKKVRCSLSHKIDYAHRTVRLTVPRSCLGRPSAVKVGSGTIVANGTKVYFDDARRVGGEFNDPFVFSPKVRR